MKPRFRNRRAEGLWLIGVVFLGFSVFWAVPGWGSSGLSLNLYTLQEGHKFPADQPIRIIGVMKNETKWPLNMDLGFSGMEIERYLIARDPQGKRHTPPFQETQAPEDMPPPSRWGDWETVSAEVLHTGWQRSVTIKDLRELFPVMKRISGWYTIEAEIPISRYGWTVSEGGSKRLLGVLDNKAWHGTLKSKKLRIFVAPSRGGRMKLRVEDLSTPEKTARDNVEVRVFKRSEVDQKSLAEAWTALKPVTAGNTGQGGWVTLPAGGACLAEPDSGDAYVAVAHYKGEYKEAYFEQGAAGWQSECGGLLTRYILFGEPPHQFSVFGLNSVWVRNKARIESGDVGAWGSSDGPWLVPEFEVSVAENAWVADGSVIKGDTVQIRSSASVWEVYCNEPGTEIDGTVRLEDGIDYYPDLPLWATVENVFPGENKFKAKQNDPAVTVDSSEPVTLSESDVSYSDVTLSSYATLILTGGEYDFMNLFMGSHSSLVCKGPTTIRIAERLYPGTKASYIGPEAGTDPPVKPEQVKIFINGQNGKKGRLSDNPKAADIGQGASVKAIIYAKNGTLLIEEGCVLEGIFIAKDVIVGMKTVVNYPQDAQGAVFP